ncbi:hypothetical protein GIB67_000741 [Kingdonia uniflora]|uniref:DNA primase n=1 Tax=Kingdonia uniflora TaxID=39325 RepID=A0A7J7NDD2_9MAGN|nr:hypothetical protein GIB67_000741 [Kingdonia uniflora]
MSKEDMLVDACEAEVFNADYLKFYYGKLFPHAEIFKWMSYGNDGKHAACDRSYFGRREFAYTIDDAFVRYQSFNSVAELEKSIKDKCPLKIDIGPVYSIDPAKRKAYAANSFTPVERELAFDIITMMYDIAVQELVCLDCWPLMTIAIKVIDTALRDDFGFNHILWVYSGRRGVHCWVCDGRARRKSICDYFRVYRGNENSNKKVSLTGPAFHPFLVLDTYAAIAAELRSKWEDNRRSSTSEDVNVVRWKQLKSLLQSAKHKGQGIRRSVEEIVFSYTYPRLDMEVSKHINHLLKAPFCVHPKTGRVCVPIDPDHCEEFDPTAVPTLYTVSLLLTPRSH